MSRRWGPLAAVLVIQLGILALVPARQVRARLTGTPVTLRTVPVDPYDHLSGYYVTLRYEVERLLPEEDPRTDAWLVVRRAEPAWKGVRVTAARPASLPEGELAIRLTPVPDARGGCVLPSACRFYIPEARREEVDAALGRSGGSGLVDLRVGEDGEVALVRFRIGELVLEE